LPKRSDSSITSRVSWPRAGSLAAICSRVCRVPIVDPSVSADVSRVPSTAVACELKCVESSTGGGGGGDQAAVDLFELLADLFQRQRGAADPADQGRADGRTRYISLTNNLVQRALVDIDDRGHRAAQLPGKRLPGLAASLTEPALQAAGHVAQRPLIHRGQNVDMNRDSYTAPRSGFTDRSAL
jgi:hypothetical protein